MALAPNLYILYADLKTYIGLATTDTNDDDLLKTLCWIASRMFDSSTHRVFYPRYEIRYFDHPDPDTQLKFDDDLLAVGTFTTQNTAVTVDSDDYYLMCGNTYNYSPYDRLVLKSDGDRTNLLYSGTLQQANAITGWWGYHENWSDAWQDSQDSVQDTAGITAAATSITVANADGTDLYGTTPRFKVGQLLRLGTEYVYVSAIDTATNILTVIRGLNGTTAAAHANAVTIYVYIPMQQIEQGTKRLAAWLYAQKDTTFVSEVATTVAGTTITIPVSAPVDVQAIAAIYKKVSFG